MTPVTSSSAAGGRAVPPATESLPAVVGPALDEEGVARVFSEGTYAGARNFPSGANAGTALGTAGTEDGGCEGTPISGTPPSGVLLLLPNLQPLTCMRLCSFLGKPATRTFPECLQAHLRQRMEIVVGLLGVCRNVLNQADCHIPRHSCKVTGKAAQHR